MFVSPVAVSIFGWEIHWYALAYAFSAIFIYWRSVIFVNDVNFNLLLNVEKKDIDIGDFLFYCGLGMIIGGKFGYLFYNFQVMYVFKPYGFSFFGGFIGVLFACLLFAYMYALNLRSVLLYLDIILSYMPIGICLVRITNLINQECIGMPVDGLLWGIKLDGEDFYRHPTQLYEAFAEGILLYYVLYFFRSKYDLVISKPGIITGLFLILYAVLRFVIEFYKDNVFSNEIFLNQLGCGMVFCFGVCVFCFASIRFSK